MTTVLKVQCKTCKLVAQVTIEQAKAGVKPTLSCSCNAEKLVTATVSFLSENKKDKDK